jgi:hypothetical protein
MNAGRSINNDDIMDVIVGTTPSALAPSARVDNGITVN